MYLLEHVKARCVSVLKRAQMLEYKPDSEKMIAKKYNLSYGRAFYWFPYMQISLHTRMMAAEVCFGEVENEEPNLAYSILSSVMKLNVDNRSQVLQNIVLSGGSCMIPGFKPRLLQEIHHLVKTHKPFEEL